MSLPQYSLRALLGLFVVFALCLALASLPPFLTAAVLLPYVIIVACTVRSAVVKRALIWGPVLGTCLFLAVAVSILRVTAEPMSRGWEGPHSIEALTIRYTLPIGGFVGGVVGLLVAASVNSRRGKAPCRSAGGEQNGECRTR